MGKLPVVVAGPLSRPAELSVTPPGSGPVSVNVGAGYPVVVTVNEPSVFTVKVVLAALVMAGGCLTVRVKLCVPAGAAPLLAVIVIAYEPPVPAPGVPLNTPAALRVTPLGSAPVSLYVIAVG